MSAGHVCGTRGSGIVSSAADVLWMTGVGVRYVCVFLRAVCVERGLGLGCGGVDGEWIGGFDQGLEGWGGMSVRCESRFFV